MPKSRRRYKQDRRRRSPKWSALSEQAVLANRIADCADDFQWALAAAENATDRCRLADERAARNLRAESLDSRVGNAPTSAGKPPRKARRHEFDPASEYASLRVVVEQDMISSCTRAAALLAAARRSGHLWQVPDLWEYLLTADLVSLKRKAALAFWRGFVLHPLRHHFREAFGVADDQPCYDIYDPRKELADSVIACNLLGRLVREDPPENHRALDQPLKANEVSRELTAQGDGRRKTPPRTRKIIRDSDNRALIL